jgi:predicted acylesterase/phospholipase RssA
VKVDVVISGGSVEGICTATGFLKAVVDDLKHEIVCGAGNSAGGIVLACHASGMTPSDIESAVVAADFASFISVPSWWNIVAELKAFRRGWLSDGSKLEAFLRSLTKDKKLKDASFDVRLAGSNFTRYRAEELHKGTRPEMPLWLASRITSCLPMGFKPVAFEDCLWYDGGVRRHYPVDFVPPSDRPFYGWLLGELSPESSKPVDLRPGALGVLSDFIDQSVDNNVQDAMLLAKRKPVTVAYDDAYVGTFDFGVSTNEKKRLIELARKKTVEALAPKG